MKTVTYDEMLWKLVPVEPTKHMIDASALDDQMNSGSIRAAWKDMVEAAPLLASTPAQPAQKPTTSVPWMTARRAAYFMERFLHEEKMLGPNEQDALRFTIEALEAMATTHQEPPRQERKPMTYREIADATSEWAHVRSDYTIGIIRAAERHHGIKE